MNTLAHVNWFKILSFDLLKINFKSVNLQMAIDYTSESGNESHFVSLEYLDCLLSSKSGSC